MKLLIIEDSIQLSKSLAKGFKNLGFIVETSNNGQDGLVCALNEEYDVIVLDLMLPLVDGLSIIKILREHNKQTNILILSARDQVDDRINGLNIGADDYLCKPFSFEELHARINRLVRRQRGIQTNVLAVGRLKVDLELKQARVADKILSLTKLEYSLLELLLLHRGRVLTYEMLESQLYDRAAEVSRNAIEAHISSVRKKLKKGGMNQLIQTRRGFGYFIARD